MNIKKKLLFFLISLLMSFFLPSYAHAGFTFSALDTQGRLLSFANPALIAGTCPSGKTCAANGDGPAYAGAKYKYTNVITVGTTRVDAIVSVDAIVNATLNTFDDATPNPTGSSRAGGGQYTTSFGVVVSEASVFAPQITTTSKTAEGYVKFTINFIDASGNPVVLKNVYNNTLDAESVEYNSYGGFQSYRVASDNLTNAKRIIATPGLNGSIRFSSSDCTGDMGLYIKDQSRVQTKFDTITSLTITNGQFANGTVPKIGGGFSTCTNSSIRYYGAIFAQDEYIDTAGTAKEYTAPTIDLLTTNDTTPSITGTLGGEVSTASPKGSAIGTGETFSVVINGVTYSYPNANLTTNGANWTLNVPTALPVGSYDIVATRNGTLLDQTTNELVITPTCTLPSIINNAGTACETPDNITKIKLCHSGNGKNYAKISIPISGLNGHETHEFDKQADSNGLCPDDPVICVAPAVRDPATNTCQTPVAQCSTIAEINSSNSSSTTIPPAVVSTTTSTRTRRGKTYTYTSTFVSICHAQQVTAGSPYPYALQKISKSSVGSHIITATNHKQNVDYYPLTGSCPTVAMPCPGTSCDLPRLIDPTDGLCKIPPDPTVDSLTTADVTPVITGWVGGFQLGDGENLRVSINGQTYYYNYAPLGKANSPELQVIGDQRWILSIPDSAPLSIGTTYDVSVTQDDTNLTDDGNENNDATTDEVVVVTAPTVNSQVTLDTTPTITGTVGNAALVSGEMFTVEINGRVYSTTNAAYPLTVNGTTWTLNVIDALPTGMTYGVLAIRNQYLADATTGELVIPDAPTVVSQTTADTTPVITGTAGSTGMKSTEPFSVVVNGKTYSRGNANLTLTDAITTTIDDKGDIHGSHTDWSLQIPNSDVLPAGTYNVTATRSTLPDLTSGELIVGCGTYQALNAAGTACVDMWNGLPVSDILALNATYNTESYLGASCQNTKSVYSVSGTIDTEWASCPRAGGVFKSHIQTNNTTNYHCHFEITGSDLSTTYVKEAQFDVPSNLTATQKWALINNSCSLSPPTPVPTVKALTTSDTTPSISGTVGGIGLSAGEAFSVTVNGTTYNKGNAALVITTSDWTLNIPTALPVGTYNVDALRNGNTPDVTTGELTISGTQPTVTPLATNDTTPTIMGTFGTNDLGANETFSVTVNGVVYTKGDGNLVTLNSSWSLTIPVGKELKNGTYEVDAVRNNTLHDLTSNELTIAIAVPTVTKQTLREKLPVVIKGTVGDVALDTNETFTVSVNGKIYTKGTDASLNISAMAWTLTIPTTETIAAGTYDVVATRDSTLVDATTDELVITPLSPPTVISQTTFDTTPVIKGTVGDVALETNETFTVEVNGKTYTKGIDTNLVVSSLNWTLTIQTGSEIAGRTAPYDVTATRSSTVVDTTSGELTIQPCALPKVVNAAGDQCITPTPTVNSQTLNTNLTVTPTITGTVGEVALGSTETFSVTIPTTTPQVYNKGDSALVISSTGLTWTLTVPAAKAIPTGTYDIVAARNTSATDKTTGELIVNLVCLTGETNVNGVCVKTSTLPSVDVLSTDDRTPTITGTVGGTALAAAEPFTVQVNGQTYTSTSGLVISGSTWSLTIPEAAVLQEGTYDVIATRNDTITDPTKGELTITVCTLPKIVKSSGDCALPNPIPTVTKVTTDINAAKIEVTGTVGDTPLGVNDSFSVKVHNSAHLNDISCSITLSGINWSCTLTKPYYAGTFDVDAKRNTKYDETSGELEVTDNIAICDMSKTPHDQNIPKTEWDGAKEGKNYYMGNCTNTGVPLPKEPDVVAQETCPANPLAQECINSVLPDEPPPHEDEGLKKTPPDIVYCDDGGLKTNTPATGVTIKRATIVNATTNNGTVELVSGVARVAYGEKISSEDIDVLSPTLDGYTPTWLTINKVEHVTLKGVTLDNVYIDTRYPDFASGGSAFITFKGGITQPTTTKPNGTITPATITNGMITAGQSATGNPVRGSVTTGQFDKPIENAATVLTKGRRIRGKLVNANIDNATITTDNGVTKVDAGVILSGTVEASGTKPVSAFGTVVNATLTGIALTNSNQCFSSGTVGSKGQLNWKEVVK